MVWFGILYHAKKMMQSSHNAEGLWSRWWEQTPGALIGMSDSCYFMVEGFKTASLRSEMCEYQVEQLMAF